VASKFQNRLVGTIIIVALGVIVLPGLLDGKKKHYQDNFASIPLVPKSGDTDEGDALPQASQSLPSQPPEGAGAAVEQANKAQAENDTAPAEVDDNPPAAASKESVPARREPVKVAPATRTELAKASVPAKPTVKPSPVKPEAKPPVKAEVKPQDKPDAKPSVKAEAKPQDKPDAKPSAKAEVKPQDKPKSPAPAKETTETAPQGQAWVVQLGALKNAARVTEIVGKLRSAGYRAYTVPSAPVAGQITRIFVGPDASKQKLESALPEMNQLSELNGQLRPYQAR
jgi:DedD protein